MSHGWRSKNKLQSDVLLWTPTHGHTSVGQPAKIYIHQLLCADPRCTLEDLLKIIGTGVKGESGNTMLSV